MNAEDDELFGAMTFLGPDLQDELASIELHHVGLISLESAAHEANKEEVGRCTVEIYVEEMKFNHSVSDV